MGICIGKGNHHSEPDEKLDFGGGNVCDVTDKISWDQKIIEATKDGKIVVANFSASWCEPCKQMASTFAEQSLNYPSLLFLTVDVDQLTTLSESLDIRATPTIYFFKDGQQLDKLVGANKASFLQKLQMLTNFST